MQIKLNEPLWIWLARSYVGTKEIRGSVDNSTIVNFWKYNEDLQPSDDETPWCASFVNYCLEHSGIKSTRKANARSYVNWGKNLKNPKIGCVCVFWRGSPNGWKGHVGFYVGETTDGDILVLGGNQGNSVSVKRFSKDRLIGYRYPSQLKASVSRFEFTYDDALSNNEQ